MKTRILRFRVWDTKTLKMSPEFVLFGEFTLMGAVHAWQHEMGNNAQTSLEALDDLEIMQYTNVNDKDGYPIFEGDVLEFADKWEWYRGSYGIKMRFAEPERLKKLQEQYDSEPMERREIQMPECYEWLLSSEIQTYWKVVGNVYQHPELLNETVERETKR